MAERYRFCSAAKPVDRNPMAGRNTVPVRSAILGTILAVTVVISTITFVDKLLCRSEVCHNR